MTTQRELLEQASLLYLDNSEECIRYRPDINDIFTSAEETTNELYTWTRSVLKNCENVSATHASGILFVSLISLSHFSQNSCYVHWKESSELRNINLFGLVVGLSGNTSNLFSLLYECCLGSDKSGLINIIQSCYTTCERIFPDVYIVESKKSVLHDCTGAGLHKELSTGNKFLLMHEADSNLTKLGFYQHGKVVS